MKAKFNLIVCIIAISLSANGQTLFDKNSSIPVFKATGDEGKNITTAWHIAMGDIFSSIRPYKNGLLKQELPVVSAGLGYPTPWTRDAAVTVQFAGALLFPQLSENTLLSMLKEDESTKKLRIGGQYWDSPIWAIGAWEQYLFSGDKAFLATALEATVNHLTFCEDEEFDAERGLFRGASFFNDGVAAYPDLYAKTGVYTGKKWVSGIDKWVDENPTLIAKKGFGLPMMALSTNCIYYKAYTLVDSMAKELHKDLSYFKAREKALKLKQNINKHFWNVTTHKYLYLVDPNGNCDYQEGAGIAMAILFGVADKQQSEYLFANTHSEPAGLPCIYPSFPRYVNAEKTSFGRHSGTIWPQVNGYWAWAAAQNGKIEIFDFELTNLAKMACRDRQFYELFHPVTGLPYGGMQEANKGGIIEWKAEERQVWAAAAYMSMLVHGIVGMNFNSKGIVFSPLIAKDFKEITLMNVPYHNSVLNIKIKGQGNKIKSFVVNGKPTTPFISANVKGIQNIEIEMTK
jgi:glycogen debranching enzyme